MEWQGNNGRRVLLPLRIPRQIRAWHRRKHRRTDTGRTQNLRSESARRLPSHTTGHEKEGPRSSDEVLSRMERRRPQIQEMV